MIYGNIISAMIGNDPTEYMSMFQYCQYMNLLPYGCCEFLADKQILNSKLSHDQDPNSDLNNMDLFCVGKGKPQHRCLSFTNQEFQRATNTNYNWHNNAIICKPGECFSTYWIYSGRAMDEHVLGFDWWIIKTDFAKQIKLGDIKLLETQYFNNNHGVLYKDWILSSNSVTLPLTLNEDTYYLLLNRLIFTNISDCIYNSFTLKIMPNTIPFS